MLLTVLIDLYSFVVVGAVVIAWMQVPPSHSVVTVIRSLTEPLLAPIRSVLPTIGGLDFSFFFLLIGLQVLRGVLL
jgi:YggT family protein